eukprot:COSAG06_NODE_39657_length_410_cov_0.778135_1_plen_70_part_10
MARFLQLAWTLNLTLQPELSKLPLGTPTIIVAAAAKASRTRLTTESLPSPSWLTDGGTSSHNQYSLTKKS